MDVQKKCSYLMEKLLSLTFVKNADKRAINSCLQELNQLDYHVFNSIDNNATMLLVNQLCSTIQPSETILVKNTCQLLINLAKSNVNFQGRTFSASKRWIFQSLEFSYEAAQNDVLLALQHLFAVGPFQDIALDFWALMGEKGSLRKFLDSANYLSESYFLAIRCLESLLNNKEATGSDMNLEFLLSFKEITLNFFLSCDFTKATGTCNKYNNIAASCLRILSKIITEKFITYNPEIVGEVLGVCRILLFHGIDGYPTIKPETLRPAAMNLPEKMHAFPKVKHFKTRKAKPKKQQQISKKFAAVSTDTRVLPSGEAARGIGTPGTRFSSDSETSDSENTNPICTESKVRLEAIKTMQKVVDSVSSREMFGYWPQIVASGTRNDARVLTRLLLLEPTSKVRQQALTVLNELLVNARPFLAHAEDVEQLSFITFFGTVSLMIKELHFTLALVLSSERNSMVLTHALKCTAALVQGTPYVRLKSGLATKLMRHCKLQILHKDPTIKVAALSVFEALASIDPTTPEILSIFEKNSTSQDLSHVSCSLTTEHDDEDEEVEEEKDVVEEDCDEEKTSDNETLPSDNAPKKNVASILCHCLKYYSDEAIHIPVRLHSLKLIGTLASNSSTRSLLFPRLEIIATTLASITKKLDAQVALHSCRVLEIIAGSLSTPQHSEESELSVAFWNLVFDSIVSLSQSTQTILREVACDCFGNIGANVFAQLSRQKTVVVVTVLFGAVRDEESAVRAAGLRALGMLVTLSSLENDTGFLMDLADAVCSALEDENLGVRVKSAWALANLCDCLVRLINNDEMEPLPLEMLLPRLYNSAVNAAQDSDKVKCNAVRAVGNILYLCPEKEILGDTSLGLDVLIKCATVGNDMKVRWNACRAIGFVLGHQPDRVLPSFWRDQVFPALTNLICDSPNFKVRTNAVWALSSCDSYGKHILHLWKNCILALENSQHVPTYVEYPHRDALVQQLCLTLGHLASRTNCSDLQNLWEKIGDHVEEISNYTKQFQERMLPEKAGILMEAKLHLERLSQEAPSTEDRKIARRLMNIFEWTDQLDVFGQRYLRH